MTADYVGFCWHVHHAHPLPLEWCYSYNERLNFIMTQKPEVERPTRVQRFQRASWPDMPQDMAETAAAYRKADAAYRKADAAYRKADAAYHKADTPYSRAAAVYTRAAAVYTRADAVYSKATAAQNKADAALNECLEAHRDEILALHRQQCPDCPWERTGNIA